MNIDGWVEHIIRNVDKFNKPQYAYEEMRKAIKENLKAFAEEVLNDALKIQEKYWNDILDRIMSD